VLLVRGGVLTRFSGIGGAFHDLKGALEAGQISGWRTAGVEEYNLGERASGLKRLRERWFRHPSRVVSSINNLHKNGEVDLVFVSDQEQAHLVPTNAAVPVVVYVHDFFHLFPQIITLSGEAVEVGASRPGFIRRRDLRRLMKGLQRADAFICSTSAVAQACQQHFPETPLYQIPYAIDVERYAPPKVLPPAPAALQSTACHLLVVGSHDPRKRLAFLVRVLAQLPENVVNDVRIHHIGGDTCPHGGPSATSLANDRGVNWHWVGSNLSEDVLNAYRWHCEALLFPSGAEGFGYPTVESMAAGQPVLAADRPAHNELMPEGTTLDPEDIEVWVKAIVEVHATWLGRGGEARLPDQALMDHVSFLAPERFNREMSNAWDTIASS
jgi:glycosyltransferase involved in cell wall biosynthesis